MRTPSTRSGSWYGRVLEEADDALGRVLDRAVEDLAAGHVRVAVVDLALASGEAEAEVGLGADDAHLIGLVEAILDPLHLLALRVPVEEDGAEEEVLERLGVRPASCASAGQGKRQVTQGISSRSRRCEERSRAPSLSASRCSAGTSAPVARVLRRAEQHPGVDVVPDVLVGPAPASSSELERRLLRPDVQSNGSCSIA